MSYHDDIMAAMRADPGRTWTTGELTRHIYPEIRMGTTEYGSRIASVLNALKSAQKYKMVEMVGKCRQGTLWRLAE